MIGGAPFQRVSEYRARVFSIWVRLFSVTDYHGIGPKIRAPATVGRRFIRRRVGNRGARAAGDKPPPYSASTQRGFSVREKSRTLTNSTIYKYVGPTAEIR